MSVPIYKNEIEDGLEEVIRANSSIAYSSPLKSHTPTKGEKEKAKLIALESVTEESAAENKNQFDLYYLNSVLVSTGWNKNDDIFDIEETWSARNTPEDKQFNFMHDETDIIGHITGNFVIDAAGQKVHEIVGVKNLPEQFDIVTSAVLYNSWSDPKLTERMAKIISEIEEDKWFVSMECLFAGFDYGVIAPDGQHKTIARSEESSFLTKHLRSYGGTGEYEGHRLGRLLRSIAFSGKGLVSNPANPKSVIINDTDLFKHNETYSITQSNIRENFNMANEDIQLLQKQNDELKAAFEQVKSDEEALRSEISKKKDEEVQAKVDAFEVSILERDEAIAKMQEGVTAFEVRIQEIEELLAKKDKELTEANSKIQAHETAIKLEARKTALVEAGFDEIDIEKALETFADVSDKMFDEIVNLTAKKDNPFFDKKKKKDDEEEEEDAGSMKKKAETEAIDDTDETVDEAEADVDVEALDNVEEDTDVALADAGNDEIDSARTSASSWLEKHVLHTTASIDK